MEIKEKITKFCSVLYFLTVVAFHLEKEHFVVVETVLIEFVLSWWCQSYTHMSVVIYKWLHDWNIPGEMSI